MYRLWWSFSKIWNSDIWKLLRLPLIQFSKFNDFLRVCWFLGKNLSNFLPLVWKLHNPYCHNVQRYKFTTSPELSNKTIKRRTSITLIWFYCVFSSFLLVRSQLPFPWQGTAVWTPMPAVLQTTAWPRRFSLQPQWIAVSALDNSKNIQIYLRFLNQSFLSSFKHD